MPIPVFAGDLTLNARMEKNSFNGRFCILYEGWKMVKSSFVKLFFLNKNLKYLSWNFFQILCMSHHKSWISRYSDCTQIWRKREGEFFHLTLILDSSIFSSLVWTWPWCCNCRLTPLLTLHVSCTQHRGHLSWRRKKKRFFYFAISSFDASS